MSEGFKASRWKPRFSLRTLVAGVLIYGALWTATEVWGGHDFRECMETRTDELRRATVAWSRTQAREAAVWQDEFYCPSPLRRRLRQKPAAEPAERTGSGRRGLGLLVFRVCMGAGLVV